MKLIRELSAYLKIRRSGRFDSTFYTEQQATSSDKYLDPVWHYVTTGWKTGLNPNQSFDTQWYMNAYPDVKRAADTLNPFVHYLQHGLGEARQPSQSGVTYHDWILQCENYDESTVSRKLATYAFHPRISILIPVYKPDMDYLSECIDSVIKQAYENWELCISDDATGSDALEKYLRKLSAADPRIKITFRQTNGHISANSNSALELATGQYVALLDQDDILGSHALYELVTRVNQNPGAKILYSDEDKLDCDGARNTPHFKPDWNKDLLYSTNYISHLGVYDRELVIDVGGFRVGYEGSQDYDLVLRCSAKVAESDIEHIPRILYHWRASEGSTAQFAEDKPYTWDSGLLALKDFMASQSAGAEVQKGIYANTFRVKWPVPKQLPLVSLIVPTRNGGKVLRKCVASILAKTDYPNIEILIIDNQSDSRDTLTYLKKLKKKSGIDVLKFDEPFNFSKIVNYGVENAKGEFIGLVNDDVEVVNQNWLTEMLGLASREDIGCVGAKLYYPDETIQHAGVILGINGVASHSHKNFPRSARGYFGRLVLTQDYSAVTAACLLVDKNVFTLVGGFDEINLSIAFNDIDFCLKVRSEGYINVWTPWAELYHYESLTRGYEDTEEKLARFNAEVAFMKHKWGSELINDPAYNPNLTLDREDFGLAIRSLL